MTTKLTTFPITPSSAPDADFEVANKKYVDDNKGTGTVTSVTAGNGLTGGTITTSGTVNLGTPGTLTSSTLNSLSTSSHTHGITTGIANTNIIKIDSASASSGEYAKLTTDGIESKSFTEVASDLGAITESQFSRQGGSATDWNTSGSTNYTVSNPKFQMGSVSCTILSGQESGNSTVVTFDNTFTGKPLVQYSLDNAGAFGSLNETPFIAITNLYPTTTQVRFTAITRSGTVGANRTFSIHWFAIGV